MAQYELSDDQVKVLKQVLANAQIRGADAPVIIELANSLSRPVVKEKKDGLRKEEGK
jgi:hypothetical protein